MAEVPPFPGAQKRRSTRELWRSFQARACSRAPFPTTSTFLRITILLRSCNQCSGQRPTRALERGWDGAGRPGDGKKRGGVSQMARSPSSFPTKATLFFGFLLAWRHAGRRPADFQTNGTGALRGK